MAHENEYSDLPDATMLHLGTSRHWNPKAGDGQPLAADPSHLEPVHVAVEHLLFRDGTPPECNLMRPSEQIRKHLSTLGNGSFKRPFGESYQLLLDTLLYGKALFKAVGRPFDPARIESEFDDVPGGLRESLLGKPILVPDWRTITLFRKQLRAAWYQVRGEEVLPGRVVYSAEHKARDVEEFVRRASMFIVDDFERHVRPSEDFYELAEMAVKAYTRWQSLLVVDAKVTTTPESRKAHLN